LRASVEHVQDPIAIEAAGQGHAGGLLALTEAVQRLSVDQSAIEVIGGVDSYYDFDTLDWLQDNRQLSNRDNRNGFAPGEAACFVALATESARHTLGLRSLGRIHGWGIGRETKLIKTDEINLGEALADAVRSSVRGLRLPEQAPDAVYCDINGERYRSEEWGFALLRVPETVRDTAYVTPVDCIGDVGAASGPLLCNLAAQAWARSYAPGPRALVWAGSESGLRAAVVLEAPSA
jgi:3-oxoacyl-[acyl-carrier-protein] synthase-1